MRAESGEFLKERSELAFPKNKARACVQQAAGANCANFSPGGEGIFKAQSPELDTKDLFLGPVLDDGWQLVQAEAAQIVCHRETIPGWADVCAGDQ